MCMVFVWGTGRCGGSEKVVVGVGGGDSIRDVWGVCQCETCTYFCPGREGGLCKCGHGKLGSMWVWGGSVMVWGSVCGVLYWDLGEFWQVRGGGIGDPCGVGMECGICKSQHGLNTVEQAPFRPCLPGRSHMLNFRAGRQQDPGGRALDTRVLPMTCSVSRGKPCHCSVPWFPHV